ncbi:MAG: TonB-dependent receptor [Phycisphaerae bacterium]|nr:TonB-dependent receptor [Gemmatimonadaceae bacterium]
MKFGRVMHVVSRLSVGCVVALPVAAQNSARLQGRVVAASGGPIGAASISVSGTSRRAATRSDGSFQFELPSGRYAVHVRAIGFSLRTDSVTVTEGVTTSLEVRLERSNSSLEAIAVLGTRGQQRTVMSAAVPIDVLSSADLTQTGRTETAQMLQSVAPSLNFPRPSVSDGTDHIRPATLRGLSPDQTLILVNGRRRHTSALVNVNGFLGRGSQAVDLNAIPASMIDHIEILRDGAAAQYGSDAIAGVINIVLKNGQGGAFSAQAGQNVTTYNRGATPSVAFPAQRAEQRVTDGNVVTSALDYGWMFTQGGYLHVGGEIRDRAGTTRSLPDVRQQYFVGDLRNAKPAAINTWQGDSYNHDAQFLLNAGETFSNGTELYAVAGYGKRRGAAAGMWRRPNDDRNVRALYPDGFLPFIKSDIADISVSVGVRGTASGWTWDLASVYGRNSFDFGVDNSVNVSLGNSSKTSFEAGRLAFGQSTSTLDLVREVSTPWRAPLRLAVGAEFRADQYRITAGEPDSYRDGGQKVLDSDGVATTRPAAPGAQVFPGFRPSDAGIHSRTNIATYLDLESDVTTRLLLSAAGRLERYSDFGTTLTGKLAARFELATRLAIRGAVSSGFRAPSLGQQFFSSTATNFIAGQAFDVRTFPVNSAEARLLGARELDPEQSVNLSAGFAVEPARGLALTADYYRIKINDRIVLSDNFVGPTIQALFETAGLAKVSGGRFFSNAIATRSNGMDIVANYDVSPRRRSQLHLSAGYNRNTVKVTRVDETPAKLAAFQETLFGRVERTRIERGNPRDNFFVSGNLSHRKFNLTARTQRYGDVSLAGALPTNATGTLDQTFKAKWVSDVSASYRLATRFLFTAGADNVFDVYPDRNLNPGDPATSNGGISNFGLFPYNGISPFGFNGRFVYSKLSVRL